MPSIGSDSSERAWAVAIYLDVPAIEALISPSGEELIAKRHATRVPAFEVADLPVRRPWWTRQHNPVLPDAALKRLSEWRKVNPPDSEALDHSRTHNDIRDLVEFIEAPACRPGEWSALDVGPEGRLVRIDDWFSSQYWGMSTWLALLHAAGVATLCIDAPDETHRWKSLYMPVLRDAFRDRECLWVCLRPHDEDPVRLGVLGHLQPVTDHALDLYPLAIGLPRQTRPMTSRERAVLNSRKLGRD